MENRKSLYGEYLSKIPTEYRLSGDAIYNQVKELDSNNNFFESSHDLVVKSADFSMKLFELFSKNSSDTGFTGTYLCDLLVYAKFKSQLRNDIYSYLLVMDLSEGHSPFGSHFGTRDYIISLLEKVLKSSE